MLNMGQFRELTKDVPDDHIIMVRVIFAYDPVDGPEFWTTSILENEVMVSPVTHELRITVDGDEFINEHC